MLFLLTENEEEEGDERKEKCFIKIKSFVVLSPQNGNFPNRYLRRGSIQKISIITDFFLFIFIVVVDTDNNPFRSNFCVHRNTRHIIGFSIISPPVSETQEGLHDSRHKEKLNFKKNICKYLIKNKLKVCAHQHNTAQHRSQQCVRNNENDESAIIPNMMMNSTKIYFYGHIQFLLLALFSPPILRLNFPLFLLIDRIKYGEKSLQR